MERRISKRREKLEGLQIRHQSEVNKRIKYLENKFGEENEIKYNPDKTVFMVFHQKMVSEQRDDLWQKMVSEQRDDLWQKMVSSMRYLGAEINENVRLTDILETFYLNKI
ncbi:unnamed protein product [Brachionus calyciflorus]|uniref:Uncharacterized protein n=1 Tax=Brachionus calyciflorus TaxID=104777 RepID=A0A814C938_9BILA|nr:unnamed protein product [Brachionus calyciflorus]